MRRSVFRLRTTAPAQKGVAFAVAVVTGLLVTACVPGSKSLVEGRPEESAPAPSTSHDSTTEPPDAGSVVAGSDAGHEETAESGDIVIDARGSGRPIDARLFGTNLPAWLGAERLGDPEFVARALASGVTTVRMPGGNWSNTYDWLGCEIGDADRCRWPWAARPSDFIAFLAESGIDGTWTVSPNETAQAAAAAVAFFNGSEDDDREIGVDREGVDWKTVGHWAQLRRAGGNPTPAAIGLWEIGNEVYGGRPELAGDQCASFGWSRVWTCDGTEYVVGDEIHDGATAIASAMRVIDPTIEIGFVGTPDAGGWSNWGNEVIESAGTQMDYYVVHHYGFDRSPAAAPETLAEPRETWASMLDDLGPLLPDGVETAVTEYNLIAFESGDSERSMVQALNGLYIAETLGQLAVNGIEVANHWNLANGSEPGGTDYGLISAEDFEPYPQFHAFEAWSKAGGELLPLEGPGVDRVRIYPTRHDDGRLTLIVLNLGETAERLALRFVGIEASTVGVSTTVATELTSTNFESTPSRNLPVENGRVDLETPSWSINVVEVVPDG